MGAAASRWVLEMGQLEKGALGGEQGDGWRKRRCYSLESLQGAAAPGVVARQFQAQCWLHGAGQTLCDGTVVELGTVSAKRTWQCPRQGYRCAGDAGGHGPTLGWSLPWFSSHGLV